MKGKIVTFGPKMIGDKQESFTANDKTFYVFTATVNIDDGLQIGDANSTLQQPKWKTNEECEITVEKNDKATHGNKFRFNFSEGLRPSTSGQRELAKPLYERMEIISQSSFSTAITYIEILNDEERKALFDKYGPDDAFINFSKRISKEVVKNAKELTSEYGSQ